MQSTTSPPACVAIVDDDANLCRSVGRLLRAAGIQAVAYPSAEAFLADTERPHFDCLLLDIHLERMSGLDLSRRLAAMGDAAPIIFITADDDPALQTEATAGGCAAFFRKNAPGQSVLQAIRQAAGLDEGPAMEFPEEKPGQLS